MWGVFTIRLWGSGQSMGQKCCLGQDKIRSAQVAPPLPLPRLLLVLPVVTGSHNGLGWKGPQGPSGSDPVGFRAVSSSSELSLCSRFSFLRVTLGHIYKNFPVEENPQAAAEEIRAQFPEKAIPSRMSFGLQAGAGGPRQNHAILFLPGVCSHPPKAFWDKMGCFKSCSV